ncbi:hypothetical protein V2J09_003280 [Rumex salicifolius]
MNQMGEEETTILMDDKLYEAARMKGNADVIPSYLMTNDEWFVGRTRQVKSNILHVAAQYANSEFIRSALAGLPAAHRHQLLCERNSKGETPLHLASRSGDKKTVEALLLAHDDDQKQKMCWIERDCKGDTPLHKALRYGHQDIAMMLLQKDVKLVSVDNNAGESPAYLAAENYCRAFLRTILDARRYVDQDSVSYSGPLGMTLFHPSRSLTEDIMLVLIKRRKEVLKHQDEKGKTVLHYAVEEAIEPMVETLVKADSSLACLHDNDGMTPLHRAASMGSFNMVRTILELSPQSIEICGRNDGKTPLHVAKMDACFLVGCLRNTRMKELINVADNQGNTPLHLAFKDSHDLDLDLDVVYALLQVGGINWRLRNNDGRTPIDLWQSQDKIPFKLVSPPRDGNMQLINEASSRLFLLAATENSKGENPLHVAAESGQLQVVQAILSHFPNQNHQSENTNRDDHHVQVLIQEEDDEAQQLAPARMKSANGDTPAHKALRNGHADVALCLLRREPQLVASVNSANESLLYLAAQLPSSDVITQILSESKQQYSISVSAPHAQNPLHALVRSGGRVTYDVLNLETLALKMIPFDMIPLLEQVVANVAPWVGTLLTERLPQLVNKVDDDGKTPLHYAAELGQHSVVRKLLKVDMSAAFMYDNEGFTPLLRAASNGYDRVVQSILELCPHSIELRHASDTRTLLHLASLSRKTLKMCIKNHPQVAKLINETDIDGNTPLHCAILESDEKKALELLEAQGIKFGIKNKQGQTPMELCNLMRKGNMKQQTIWLAFEGGEMVKGIMPPQVLILSWLKSLLPMFNDLLLPTEADMKKLLDNVAVAAALLVTLTFAATFTIPGGYDQNSGQVLRMKEPAIKVFVVSDVVAMLLGISVLLKYTFGVIKHASWGPLTAACVVMLQYALQATIIAFISGVYAIVSHDAKWIGVLAILLGVSLNIILAFIW